MEEGFIVEKSGLNHTPSIWIEGAPEPSTWTFTKVFGKNGRVVASYRCTGCGYLESFATREWTGKI